MDRRATRTQNRRKLLVKCKERQRTHMHILILIRRTRPGYIKVAKKLTSFSIIVDIKLLTSDEYKPLPCITLFRVLTAPEKMKKEYRPRVKLTRVRYIYCRKGKKICSKFWAGRVTYTNYTLGL